MNDPAPVTLGPVLLADAAASLAHGLSDGRRTSAVLVNGPRRAFGTDLRRVFVPFPLPADGAAPVATCGIALQAAPTKELVGGIDLAPLGARERAALVVAEGEAALGWALERWPGLSEDFARLVPELEPVDPPDSAGPLLVRAARLAGGRGVLCVPELLGGLPGPPGAGSSRRRTMLNAVSRRLPWSGVQTRPLLRFADSVPIGGQGGMGYQDSPEVGFNEDVAEEEYSGARLGIPYDEWDGGREQYRRDFVTVFERVAPPTAAPTGRRPHPLIAGWIRRTPDRGWTRRREDGTDLDVEAYVEDVALARAGLVTDGRVYAAMEPAPRDVATAILLDATGSLSAGRLMAFQVDCALALGDVLADAREPHAVFAFNGESRHRVEVHVLRDFASRSRFTPAPVELSPRGYTRLGAAVRHVSRRLRSVPARRRILLALGDGLPSDEGYEGRYAIADSVRAFDEAGDDGVIGAYVGLGPVGRDPLRAALGPDRFARINTLEDLGPVLATIHERLRQ